MLTGQTHESYHALALLGGGVATRSNKHGDTLPRRSTLFGPCIYSLCCHFLPLHVVFLTPLPPPADALITGTRNNAYLLPEQLRDAQGHRARSVAVQPPGRQAEAQGGRRRDLRRV